jgi:NAD(P)-dependent dehydrogenase (short-subunit alcohol dehydrogenase family)
MQLEGKRIAVIGGGNGCGAAVVRAYVREGAHVASFDIIDDAGEAVVAQANSNSNGACKAEYHHIDISQRASVKDAFAAGASSLGGYDILVMTAGVSLHVPPEEYTDADWDHMIDINLKGTFLTNQEIFPYLVHNGGGRIINFASGAGIRAYPTGAAYAASKGGIIAWTRSIAYAWGKHNITANTVNPATQGGLMSEKAIQRMGFTDMVEGFKAMGMGFENMFPLGKRRFPSSPEDENLPEYYGGDADLDLAPVLVYLASDGARFLTAQMIGVDGGMDPNR